MFLPFGLSTRLNLIFIHSIHHLRQTRMQKTKTKMCNYNISYSHIIQIAWVLANHILKLTTHIFLKSKQSQKIARNKQLVLQHLARNRKKTDYFVTFSKWVWLGLQIPYREHANIGLNKSTLTLMYMWTLQVGVRMYIFGELSSYLLLLFAF